jgi:hypothetical protein
VVAHDGVERADEPAIQQRISGLNRVGESKALSRFRGSDCQVSQQQRT